MTALFAVAAALRFCPAWAILLCAALAFAPSARLHVHQGDHSAPLAGVLGPNEGSGGERLHEAGPHLAADSSHDHHQTGVSTEFDASPKLALKKVTSALVVALLAIATLTLLVPAATRSLTARLSRTRQPPQRYHLAHPARAPPAQ
jgi:hypothetical protein